MNPASRSRTATPSRRDQARALFREAILDAAEVVFAEQGFHAARVQDIALVARTAVGTVYNHFEQKEDLLHALLEERTQAMAAALAVQPGDPANYRERLAARIRRMLEYAARHRAFFRLAQDYGLLAPARAGEARELAGRRLRHVERVKAAFRALVEEGVAEGAIEARDPAMLAMCLGGTVKAVMTLRGEADDAGALASQVVDLFLGGAGRRAHSQPARGGRKR
jgi:AcrR family transcriptional regulator